MFRYIPTTNYGIRYWPKMLQYVYVLEQKYAVVYWLKMSQYIYFFAIENTPLFTGLKCHSMYILEQKYAVVYWLKMSQYEYVLEQNTPLFTGLKCHSIYVLERKYAVVHWLKMSQHVYVFEQITPLFTGLKCDSTYIFFLWSKIRRCLLAKNVTNSPDLSCSNPYQQHVFESLTPAESEGIVFVNELYFIPQFGTSLSFKPRVLSLYYVRS